MTVNQIGAHATHHATPAVLDLSPPNKPRRNHFATRAENLAHHRRLAPLCASAAAFADDPAADERDVQLLAWPPARWYDKAGVACELSRRRRRGSHHLGLSRELRP